MPPDRNSVAPEDSKRPLSSSCLACRARKVKCDSGRPCSGCAATGGECVYKERQKPGLRAGMGSELLERVNTLEATMAYQTKRIDELVNQLSGNRSQHSNVGPSLPSAQQLPSPLTFNMFSASSASAAAANTPSSSSTTTTTGFPMQTQQDSPVVAAAVVEKSDLPPQDMLVNLIDLYYQHVFPLAPIILREDLGPQVTSEGGTDWTLQTYAVIAVALPFSEDLRWGTNGLHTKEHYHQLARNKIIMAATSNATVPALLALALVALHDISGSPPTGWGSLALLSRTAIQAGLLTEGTARAQGRQVNSMRLLKKAASFAEEESRRRLLWAVFIMDRWTCSTTGWNFSIPDDQILRRLPATHMYWTNNSPVVTPLFSTPSFPLTYGESRESVDEAFTALLEVSDLLGQVHQLHRQPEALDSSQHTEATQILNNAIRQWFDRLSSTVRDPAVTPIIFSIMGLYHATLIKLHSHLAYPHHRSVTADADAVATIHSSALEIAEFAPSVSHHSPYLSWAFFVASRVLIVRAHREQTDVDPAINRLLQALEVSSNYFDLARRYTTLIRGALSWLANLSQAGLNSAETPHSTAVNVLIDLRHTAFASEGAEPMSGTVTPVEVDFNLMGPGLDLDSLVWDPADSSEFGGMLQNWFNFSET